VRYFAFNGFGHSLGRYFDPAKVLPVDRLNWNNRNAEDFGRGLTAPATLIGFSDGATAAITAAVYSPHVVHVIAHSPMVPRCRLETLDCPVDLYRTIGDTTPTFAATANLYQLAKLADVAISIEDLDPLPPITGRGLILKVMAAKVHQFHNLLAKLPAEILSDYSRDLIANPPKPSTP
jgi:alpha/beta superfamily hydrolase